ncbi:hypothetical protein JOH51_001259 [Rhizobium leguminosarum]|nr:hypothetical protein [Rhizobium leguminosarum]
MKMITLNIATAFFLSFKSSASGHQKMRPLPSFAAGALPLM